MPEEFVIVSKSFICSDASLAARAVYLALMMHADQRDDAREVWPSYERIMECSGIRGKATIATALAELEAKGWITRRKRFSGATVYSLARNPIPISSEIELPVVQNLNDSSSKIERMDDAPVVQNLNHSSSKSEPPVVQKLNPNKNHRTRITEQESPIVRSAKRADAPSEEQSMEYFESTEKEDPAKSQIPDEPQDESTPDVKKANTLYGDCFVGVGKACSMDHKVPALAKRVSRTAKYLAGRSIDPTMIERFIAWWNANDWRGQRGNIPTPELIMELWIQFERAGEKKNTSVSDKQVITSTKSVNAKIRRSVVTFSDDARAKAEAEAKAWLEAEARGENS